MTTTISNDSRPRKRQRVSRACDSCRGRKTACDGRRPVCMACESRDAAHSCSYEFVPLRQSGAFHADDDERDESGRLDGAQKKSKIDGMMQGQAHRREKTDADALPSPTLLEEAPSDGLATFAGNADQAAYGPSSTIAFLRNVLGRGSRTGSSTPNGYDGLFKPSGSSSSFNRMSQTLQPARPVRSEQAVLPLRRNADDFLACYWEFIHPVFPLLYRVAFVEQYERLWTAHTGTADQLNDIEETVFMSMLNLVFALGCKLSNLIPSTQKPAVADSFYQKTRALSEYLLLDSTSIATVQLLALSSVYLQSTQYASRCWNSAGLAIRAAQSLGLHTESSERRPSSQLKREMRKRIWHTCVSLDRLLSMTFGRPPMIITPTDVPLPAMIDDEYLSTTTEGHQPAAKHSRLGAFVHSCKLFELLGEVLNFLSSPLLQSTAQTEALDQVGDVLSRVRALNRKLDGFSESVCHYLRMSDQTSMHATAKDNHTHLQRRVLHCRLMLVRLLLLRPLLLMSTRMQPLQPIRASDNTTQSTLDAELVKNYCRLCLATAYLLVDVIYYNLDTLYRSAGWHAVYFVFSSAIVLLASLKCPLVDIRSNNEIFEDCWTRCMAVFEHYRDQIPSAAHAVLVLRAIRGQITQGNDNTVAVSTDPPTSELATKSAASSTTQTVQDLIGSELNFEEIDLLGFNDISDAWFGQQLMNLDWLELPEL